MEYCHYDAVDVDAIEGDELVDLFKKKEIKGRFYYEHARNGRQQSAWGETPKGYALLKHSKRYAK